MKAFSQATIEKLGYYVYLLRDPRNDNKPFYVGKGTGNRIYEHLLEALKKDNKDETEKIKTIREIEPDKVVLTILRHGLTEEEAREIESAIIDSIGLKNLTNILLGYHSQSMTPAEIKIKYEPEDAKFDEFAILININELYNPKMNSNEMYEATRKYWKVDLKKAEKIKLACSVYKGIIRGVFIIDRWYKSTVKTGRKEFEGRVADKETKDKYIYKSVDWKGQNPIKYVGPSSNSLKT